MSFNFGTLDYLEIIEENQNQPLTHSFESEPGEYKPPYDRNTEIRPITRDINEYFAYQLMIALGLPAPKTTLFKNIKNNGTVWVKSALQKGEQDIDKTWDPDLENQGLRSKAYDCRLDPSMVVAFLGEMIIQDGDNFFDWYYVNDNHRMYHFTYDKDETSVALLPPLNEKDKLKKQYQWYKKRFSHGFSATIDQEITLMLKLETLLKGDPSPLKQIFYNARVAASPDLNVQKRDKYYSAWLKNAVTLIAFHRELYHHEYKYYMKREEIRKQFAEIIISRLDIPEDMSIEDIYQRLIKDLRGPLYFNDLIKETNEDLFKDKKYINAVIKVENDRLAHISLDQKLTQAASRIANEMLSRIYPKPSENEIIEFYMKKKNEFLSLYKRKTRKDDIPLLEEKFTAKMTSSKIKEELQQELGKSLFITPAPIVTLPVGKRYAIVIESQKRLLDTIVAQFLEAKDSGKKYYRYCDFKNALENMEKTGIQAIHALLFPKQYIEKFKEETRALLKKESEALKLMSNIVVKLQTDKFICRDDPGNFISEFFPHRDPSGALFTYYPGSSRATNICFHWKYKLFLSEFRHYIINIFKHYAATLSLPDTVLPEIAIKQDPENGLPGFCLHFPDESAKAALFRRIAKDNFLPGPDENHFEVIEGSYLHQAQMKLLDIVNGPRETVKAQSSSIVGEPARSFTFLKDHSIVDLIQPINVYGWRRIQKDIHAFKELQQKLLPKERISSPALADLVAFINDPINRYDPKGLERILQGVPGPKDETPTLAGTYMIHHKEPALHKLCSQILKTLPPPLFARRLQFPLKNGQKTLRLGS